MAAFRTFSPITVDHVLRIKLVARDRYGILFDPPDGTHGTAIGHTPFGDCVVSFAHDSAQAALVLTLVQKPRLLPAGLLWSAFKDELERLGLST